MLYYAKKDQSKQYKTRGMLEFFSLEDMVNYDARKDWVYLVDSKEEYKKRKAQ